MTSEVLHSVLEMDFSSDESVIEEASSFPLPTTSSDDEQLDSPARACSPAYYSTPPGS